MSRVWSTPFRRLLGAAALVIGLAGAVVPVPAGAQDRTAERDRLEKRRVELDGEITNLNRQIDQAEVVIAAQTKELRQANAVLELTADEFTRTVEARKEPARLRLLVAIDAYERGDARVTNYLAELVLRSTESEQISQLSTQREIYAAVVEDAENRINAINQKLRDLNAKVTQQQASAKGVQDKLNAAIETKRDSESKLQQRAAERAAVQRQLDALLATATTGLFTGLPSLEDRNRPALIVKIDNVEDARPPVGVNNADIVYEELVEGGLTRLAAVFHSRGAEPVGPVRSARSTDVNLFPQFNRPLFANSGGNAGVRYELSQSTLVDAGNSAVPNAYWRENNRVVPHNLFASTSEIWSAKGGEGGPPPAMFSFRAPGAPAQSGVPAAGVSIRFPTAIDFDWTGSGWARSQKGSPHVDSEGVRITPANVIVQFTQYKTSSADPNSPEAITTGSGDVWVFTGGRLIRGTWNRKDKESITTYTDDNGNVIRLAPGSTWIELPRPGSAEPR